MSRVGRQPIAVPQGVTVRVEGQVVHVEGTKGKLSHTLPRLVQAQLQDKTLTIARTNETTPAKALHGLSRTLVNNMILGVTQGFGKELEIQGVGYKGQVEKSTLTLLLGFSHPVMFPIPEGVTVEMPKPTVILIKGTNKALVGQVAASIRAIYPAEPYKGMGIRYAGEVVRRKAGKAAATGKA